MFSYQVNMTEKKKLRNKTYSAKKVKDFLTKKVKEFFFLKTDLFQWMLELCRLIFVLTIFLVKINFRRRGAENWRKLRSAPLPHRK